LEGVSETDSGLVTSQIRDGCTILLSPGANTIPSTSVTGTGANPVKSGYGCAAASVGAGVVIVDGFETTDLFDADSETIEEEWRDSRLGRSLGAVFAAHAAADLTQRRMKKVALILGVNGDVTSLKQQQAVMRTVEGIYKEVMETKRLLTKSEGSEDEYVFGLEDVYDVMLVELKSEEDATKVLAMAVQSAPERTPDTSALSALVSDTYSSTSKPSSLLHSVLTSPRSVTSDLLVCNSAYIQNARVIRARLAPWKQRVARNLLIEKFGAQASNLYETVLQDYDYETCSVAGGAAASYRLAQRAKLEAALSLGITNLFRKQLSILEQNSIKQLEKKLLQLRKADVLTKIGAKADAEAANARMAKEYDDKAAAIRAAAFSFDNKASDLEVPPLSLNKNAAGRELSSKLDEALSKFDSSPLAQLQDMKLMTKTTSRQAPIKKKQKGTEPSVDIGLSLVAMFRPDGYGNLQGYAGYNLGPHSITVGVQNDADSPEVMNQFGGVRPPFLRVQPKLNFDVEL